MDHSAGQNRQWFRVAGNRCALDLRQLLQPMSWDKVISLLQEAGLATSTPNPVAVARACIGTSSYVRAVPYRKAPAVVDCSSFTKWVFAQCGIWLPRRSIQQRLCGDDTSFHSIRTHDLVFTTGPRNYHLPTLARPVGHVGIASELGTVIHAATPRLGVREVSLDQFTHSGRIFAGAVHIIPQISSLLTVHIPEHLELETEDDVRWFIAIRATQTAIRQTTGGQE